MKLSLHTPGLREMDFRRQMLADPATMSYNAGKPLDAPGYQPSTGCIDFPMGDWRLWRELWLWQEPDRYSAYLWDEEHGRFVGECCYYYDAEHEAHGVGILIQAIYRNRGYGTEGVRLLTQRALATNEISSLFAELPAHDIQAQRVFLRNGYQIDARTTESVLMSLNKEVSR